jgi:C_GCAxxG_C_C family probable redox protein
MSGEPGSSKKTERAVNRRRFLGAAGVCPVLALTSVSGRTPTGREAQPALELTAEDRVALALMRFRMGFHCSQSVLETYAEDFGIEPETARRMAAALAGGSTVGGECGAVSAGYLVLGLRHGRLMPAHGNVEREAELFDRIRRFVEEFRSRHGALSCRELLGVDVFTPEGREEGLRQNLFATRCPGFIRDAVTLLEDLG